MGAWLAEPLAAPLVGPAKGSLLGLASFGRGVAQ